MPKNLIDLVMLEDLLAQLPTMSKEELAAAEQTLAALDIAVPDEPKRRPGITCPITQLSLVSTCQLTGCPYSIDNEWSRNCLLEYMSIQESETLEPEEISFLYHTSVQKVKKAIDHGLAQLRVNSQETLGITIREPAKTEELLPNIGEESELTVTKLALSPPFMGKVNDTLAILAPDSECFQHQSIRLLGILESIVQDL